MVQEALILLVGGGTAYVVYSLLSEPESANKKFLDLIEQIKKHHRIEWTGEQIDQTIGTTLYDIEIQSSRTTYKINFPEKHFVILAFTNEKNVLLFDSVKLYREDKTLVSEFLLENLETQKVNYAHH